MKDYKRYNNFMPTRRPKPKPTPRPTPIPTPRPIPIPRPTPRPIPIPRPTPRPIPIPRPTPKPIPIPRPTPRPIPISPSPVQPGDSRGGDGITAPVDSGKSLGSILDNLDSIIESIISSGRIINPKLTEEDLKDLDPAIFLQQAENSIAPEYLGKFSAIKDEFTRSLNNIGYDLNLKKNELQRVSRENLEIGTEDLAGRGLAFSGQRERFGEETEESLNRATEGARTLAFRTAQNLGSSAEGLVGTENVRGYLGGQTLEGRQPFEFGSTPQVGSLVSERQHLKESMAKELERQARERKAFANRSLAFA